MDVEYDSEGAPPDISTSDGFTIPDGRLSLAINMDEAEDVLAMSRYTARCKSHKYWFRVVVENNIVFTTNQVCRDYNKCIEEWVDTFVTAPDMDIRNVGEMVSRHLNNARGHFYKDMLPRQTHSKESWYILQKSFQSRLKADTLKNWYRRNWRGEPLTYVCQNPLIFDSTLCMFSCSTHGKSICPTSLVLGALDSIQRRFSAKLYAFLVDYTGVYPGESFLNRVIEIDSAIIQARALLGNNIYRVLNSWYSLFVSSVITESGDLGCTSLRRDILDSLSTHVPGFERTRLYRLMTRQATTEQERNINFELTGVVKAYSAPIINLDEGLHVLRKAACTIITPTLEESDELELWFKASFCRAYYRRHGRWPNVDLYPGCHPTIVEAVRGNYWPRSNVMRNLPVHAFHDVQFSATFTFDYHLDVFDLLQDKACCVPLEAWTSLYDKCGFSLHWQQIPPRVGQHDRRVIVKYLTSTPDHPVVVAQCAMSGINSRSDDIVLLVPKENELKVDARTFSVVTYDKKIQVGQLGANMSKEVLPLYGTQTMTDSEITFLKKVSRLSLESTKKSKSIYCTLDFLKFNNNWQLGILLGVLMCLDSLFDSGSFFVDLHRWFQRCHYVAGSRTRPPQYDSQTGLPVPGLRCHNNHQGGLEGMGQKVWTVAVQIIIERALIKAGLRGSIIGQGDNQTVVIRLTADQTNDAPSIAQRFIDTLGPMAEAKHVPLKRTECWFSQHLLEAHKELYYKGTQLRNALKFAIKSASDANDATNTFETKIAAVSTIGESISRRSHNPDIGYAVVCFETIVQSYQEGLLGPDIQNYLPIPVWTTAIGGLPIATYSQLAMRGHPDRLTATLSLMKYLKSNYLAVYKGVNILSPMEFSSNPSPELLLADPHAVDYKRYLSVSRHLKTVVKEVIRQTTTNQAVTKYFSPDIDALGASLARTLLTMEPYIADLGCELYRCSNAGLSLQIVALFDSTRTIVRLAQKADKGSVIQTLRHEEDEFKKYLQELWKRPQHSSRLSRYLDDYACPTHLARRIRLDCWKIDVCGGTVALPVDQLTFKYIDIASREEFDKSMLVTISDELISGKPSNTLTVGPYKPYLGSKTVEKVTKTVVMDIPKTRHIEAAMRLVTLESWVKRVGGPQLLKLVSQLVEEKQVDVRSIAPVVLRGNIHHRLSTPLDSTGCIINTLLHLLTHVKCATSSMKYYCAGEKDWTIFFQPSMLYTGMFFTRIAEHSQLEKMHLACFECQTCTYELQDTRVDIKGSLPLPVPVEVIPEGIVSSERRPHLMSLAVASKLADAYRKVQVKSVGDPGDLVEEALPAPTNTVSLSDFRRCNLSVLGVLTLARIPYMVYWARKYKQGRETPPVPMYLLPLADCLLRTGRLDEASREFGFDVSYNSTKQPGSLARQLFTAIVDTCFAKTTLAREVVGLHFTEEKDWFPNRLRNYEEVFNIGHVELVDVGSMVDVTLYESSEIVRYDSPTCTNTIPVLKQATDCSSIQGRLELRPSLASIQQPLYHLARGLGRGSSAASKYIQVLLDDKMPQLDPTLIMCLADGCGGVLNLLLHLYPRARGIFNTLMNVDLDALLEPGVYTPSALVGCGMAERLLDLDRSVTGSTDICLQSTKDKISNFMRIPGVITTEVLLTMDAESSATQPWKGLLEATLSYINPDWSNFTAITKLIIPAEELVHAHSYIGGLPLFQAYNWFWTKPITSNSYNNEYFLVLSTRLLDVLHSTPWDVRQLCQQYSSVNHLQDIIDVGLKLKSLIPCMNISSQNLHELTGFPIPTLTPTKLYWKVRNLLCATWEELEEDGLYTNQIKRRGRELALEEMVLPLFLLLHFWYAGRIGVGTMMNTVSTCWAKIVHVSKADRDLITWPNDTSYTIQIGLSVEGPTMRTQTARVLKKVVRASLKKKAESERRMKCTSAEPMFFSIFQWVFVNKSTEF